MSKLTFKTDMILEMISPHIWNDQNTTLLISTSWFFIYLPCTIPNIFHSATAGISLWIFLIFPAVQFIILLFLKHKPYLPSANPGLSTAGGFRGKSRKEQEKWVACRCNLEISQSISQSFIWLMVHSLAQTSITSTNLIPSLGVAEIYTCQKHTRLQEWESGVTEYSQFRPPFHTHCKCWKALSVSSHFSWSKSLNITGAKARVTSNLRQGQILQFCCLLKLMNFVLLCPMRTNSYTDECFISLTLLAVLGVCLEELWHEFCLDSV